MARTTCANRPHIGHKTPRMGPACRQSARRGPVLILRPSDPLFSLSDGLPLLRFTVRCMWPGLPLRAGQVHINYCNPASSSFVIVSSTRYSLALFRLSRLLVTAAIVNTVIRKRPYGMTSVR